MFSTSHPHITSMHGMWSFAHSHAACNDPLPTIDNTNDFASDSFGTIGYTAESVNLQTGGSEVEIDQWWQSQSFNGVEATLSDDMMVSLFGPDPEVAGGFAPSPTITPPFGSDSTSEFVANVGCKRMHSPRLIAHPTTEPAPLLVHPPTSVATLASGSQLVTVPVPSLTTTAAQASPVTPTPDSICVPKTGKRTKRTLSDSDSTESSQMEARPAKKTRKSKRADAAAGATPGAAKEDTDYESSTFGTLLQIMQGLATKRWSPPQEVIDLTIDEDHPTTVFKETKRELGEFTKRVLAESVPKGARGGRICGPVKSVAAPTLASVSEPRSVSAVTTETARKGRAVVTGVGDGSPDAVPAAKKKAAAPRKNKRANKGKATEGKDGLQQTANRTVPASLSSIRTKNKWSQRNPDPPALPPPVIAAAVDFVHRPSSSTSESSVVRSSESSNRSTASPHVKSAPAIPMPVVANPVIFDFFSQR
ncbi:hypothetical protein SCP_0802030 [Sparassis crispa]|uniref:Uncharacterized protein n=1 Tax=Sparassis crispa TaxID=139825 RepID=A0A401GTX3_9APHY|nr:hypothetical protein SCP_0802030 [Sparassis crispa]GBE85681.1 hypothetical protein SCP_0802030 [Sparassis crispa]